MGRWPHRSLDGMSMENHSEVDDGVHARRGAPACMRRGATACMQFLVVGGASSVLLVGGGRQALKGLLDATGEIFCHSGTKSCHSGAKSCHNGANTYHNGANTVVMRFHGRGAPQK